MRACVFLLRLCTVCSIRDAPLTAKGREQARGLHRATRTNVQQEVELIVSSPFRRTMQTTLGGYPEAIERLGGKEKIILLPEAQECNNGIVLGFREFVRRLTSLRCQIRKILARKQRCCRRIQNSRAVSRRSSSTVLPTGA